MSKVTSLEVVRATQLGQHDRDKRMGQLRVTLDEQHMDPFFKPEDYDYGRGCPVCEERIGVGLRFDKILLAWRTLEGRLRLAWKALKNE